MGASGLSLIVEAQGEHCMCAAGARGSVLRRPAQPHPILNHRLPRWRRGANDNHPQTVQAYRAAVMLAGMALICSLALTAALMQA